MFQKLKFLINQPKHAIKALEINKSQEMKLKLTKLQNETYCKNNKQLICLVEQACGFGCQLQWFIVCSIRAYYSNRSLIFKDNDFSYDVHSSPYKKLYNSNVNRLSNSINIMKGCSEDPDSFQLGLIEV